VAIARALAADPQLIIADEPTSNLDAPFKKEILDLLMMLREKRNLTLILITHDLRVATHLSDRLVFLYKGRIMESGKTSDIVSLPLHPYTKLLFSVIHSNESQHFSDWDGKPVSGFDNNHLGKGCSYYPDCPVRDQDCLLSVPDLKLHKGDRQVACHLVPDTREYVIEN
jgi:oligopeptide/dipeptide ABC transporter ATP-binding protein